MLEKPLVYLATKSSMLEKHLNKCMVDHEGSYLARFGVLTNCVKDTVGCVYYVKQSLNNDKIPEDKRKFVASLDLANGILMVLTQIILGFSISSPKMQKIWTTKLFGHLNDETFRNKLFEKIKNNETFRTISKEGFNKIMDNVHKTCKEGFTVVSSLVAATIIAKRAIVPFISTPLASYVKDKYMN